MGPLLVFDFDHTITDLNTDVEVQKLAPGGEIPARGTAESERGREWKRKEEKELPNRL